MLTASLAIFSVRRASSRAATAARHCQVTDERPVNTAIAKLATNAAIIGLRTAHFQHRSTTPVSRAWTGLPSRNSARSSAIAPAVAYRPAGSRAIAFWITVSRSRGIDGPSFRNRGGSSSITCRINA